MSVNPYQNVLRLIDTMNNTAQGSLQTARQLEQRTVQERLGEQRRYQQHQQDMEDAQFRSDLGTDAYRDRLAMRGELPASDLGDGDALSLLRGFEGFRETPYYDVNADRIGYGSDTITNADGSVRRVRKGDRVSRADAERDLSRRAGEFAQGARGKIGGDAWDALPGGAKAALTSVAYNYGSIPDRIVGAARSGDLDALARAVEGLGSDNNGINRRRRAKEASYIRGSRRSTGGAGPAVESDVVSSDVQLDPFMSSRLNEMGLKPVGMTRMQTSQFNLLPKEMKARFVPYATSQQRDRYGNVPYIMVEPVEQTVVAAPADGAEAGKEDEQKPATRARTEGGKLDISKM